MRQRVVIALALAGEPKLIVADEPTTALDVSIQAQIISLLKRLCKEHGAAVMLVTHDMGVIAETCDRVAVMYAGRIVEIGPVDAVIHSPAHPYTVGLMGSIPAMDEDRERLLQIDGAMPRLNAIPAGCAFNPRCPRAFDRCRVERPDLLRRRRDAGRLLAACRAAGGCMSAPAMSAPLVEVDGPRQDLRRLARPGSTACVERKPRQFVHAVDGVELRDRSAARRWRWSANRAAARARWRACSSACTRRRAAASSSTAVDRQRRRSAPAGRRCGGACR